MLVRSVISKIPPIDPPIGPPILYVITPSVPTACIGATKVKCHSLLC